jgi:hypothetical protein
MTSTFLGRRALRGARRLGLLAVAGLLGACATHQPYDYTAFKQNRPATLLVLPPVSTANDIKASPAVLAQATLPLAEAGYYVLPVTLVDETFKQNGLTVPDEMHAVAPKRLREIFGADAAVYLRVSRYGTTYQLISSVTMVEAEARIVDLRSGDLLWAGKAVASSAESDSSNQGGLVGLLVKAVVNQIVGTATDASFNYAGLASQRLLGAPRPNGVLYGPRSPNYLKD